uniref:Uncharacterized protein n=1 Tax=Octopus bimaculoides TaxID=37653 RepID=A0A0L8GB90_OCTBM
MKSVNTIQRNFRGMYIKKKTTFNLKSQVLFFSDFFKIQFDSFVPKSLSYLYKGLKKKLLV